MLHSQLPQIKFATLQQKFHCRHLWILFDHCGSGTVVKVSWNTAELNSWDQKCLDCSEPRCYLFLQEYCLAVFYADEDRISSVFLLGQMYYRTSWSHCSGILTKKPWDTAHMFVSSRLDYFNSLLYSINNGLLKKLLIVHNAAARVVTCDRSHKCR